MARIGPVSCRNCYASDQEHEKGRDFFERVVGLPTVWLATTHSLDGFLTSSFGEIFRPSRLANSPVQTPGSQR